MLGFFFGLHARLGRLPYFLSCLGFGLVVGIMAFGIVRYLGRQYATGFAEVGAAFLVPLFVIGAMIIWLGICLQSMRLRDMGWNPVIVVPAYFVLIAIDTYVAAIMPAFAVGKQSSGTPVGAIASFVFNVALLFWPSSADEPESADRQGLRRADFERDDKPRYQPQPPEPALKAQPVRQGPIMRKNFGRLGQ